jgi:cyclase
MSDEKTLPDSLLDMHGSIPPPIDLTPALSIVFTHGANVGLFHGPDGVFIIDSAFAADAPIVLAKAQELGTPRLLINTHWHHDHVTGNPHFAQNGIPVMAHANTLARLSTPQYLSPLDYHIPPFEEAGRPNWTFTGDMSFRANGDTMRLVHLPRAHSDGDLIVHFENANIILANDFFVPEEDLPFVDFDGDGNYMGFLRAIDRIIGMCDDETIVVPGHAREMGTRTDLICFREKVASMADRVRRLRAAGKGIDELDGAMLFREEFAGGAFLPDLYARMIYRSIEEDT